MITLSTRTSLVNCDAVVAGDQYPYLHIHTHELSRIDADRIFDDPAETDMITAFDAETSETQVYTGYTSLYSVQKSPFIPGDLLIWLTKEV